MKLKVIYKNGVPFAVHNEKEYRFELEKDDWQSEIKKVFPRLYNSGMDKDFIRHTEDGFMEGYKAAQSKGCFTEEDMNWVANMASGMAYSGKTSSEIANQLTIKINSLKQPKQLVSIEVEETFKRPSEIDISNEMKTSGNINNLSLIQTPKVIKLEDHPDGLLTIKQYYYE